MIVDATWPLEAAPLDAFDGIANGGMMPYVTKVTLPVHAEVAVFGDLHGAAHSILRTLLHLHSEGALSDELRIVRPTFYMLFLGDMVDRGFHGTEVLYVIMLLASRNPHRVFLARGNHEDARMNYGDDAGSFLHELQVKFAGHHAQLNELFKVYEMLPVAVFIGTSSDACRGGAGNYMLAVHGGIEVGFDPLPLLSASCSVDAGDTAVLQYARITQLLRQTWLQAPPQTLLRQQLPRSYPALFRDFTGDEYPAAPTDVHPPLGFMWWDFFVTDAQRPLGYQDSRGFIFGLPATHHWLMHNRLAGVLRAHQHNNARECGPMLRHLVSTGGIVDNWNHSGRVLTFLSGGYIPGLDFKHDSYGVLTVGGVSTVQWRLQHCKQLVAKPSVATDSTWRCNPHTQFICEAVAWTPLDHVSDMATRQHNVTEVRMDGGAAVVQ